MSTDVKPEADAGDQAGKDTTETTAALHAIDKISSSPLEFAYSFWFSKRPSKGAPAPAAVNASGQAVNYDANLRLVGTFNTVEKFWYYYCHMSKPHDLNGHADIHLFKDGIKPLWEDEANKNGGKWIVRLKKGLANRCWENLILAILGEQFMVGEEICGAVVSVRFQEDLISIWNKTCSNQAVTSRIKDTLKRILNLPPSTILEYKSHNDSLKDNSSFRNTFYCDK
jgi:translation initiation factor 4E